MQEGFSRQSQLQQILQQHSLATASPQQSGLSDQQVFTGFCSSAQFYF